MIDPFKAYDEGLKLMSDPSSSEEILGFELSETTKSRVRELLDKKRGGVLTARENAELAAYEDVALFMEMKRKQLERKH